MTIRTRSTITAGALLAMASLFTLSNSDARAQTSSDAGAQTSSAVALPHVKLDSPTVRVDPMPEDSPLKSVRHILDPLTGRETETQNFYKNGDFETFGLGLNGKKSTSHLENRYGVVLAELSYASDGTTVTGGFKKRADGTTLMQIVSQGGVTITTTYWWDGSLYLTQVSQSNGSFTSEYHHKNGKLWMRRSGPDQHTTTREETFNATGQVEFIREPHSSTFTLTTLRTDGTVSSKREFKYTSNSYSSKPTLQSVEEYAADGKTLLRKTTLESPQSQYGYYYYYGYGNQNPYPTVIEIHNADGTVKVHNVRKDLSVSDEQILDASGAVTSKTSFIINDPAAPPVETFDQGLINAPDTGADPGYVWQNSEDSDTARSPDL